VLDTPNPSLQAHPDDDNSEEVEKRRKHSEAMMKRECGTLLLEIDRLQRSRNMQDKRLKNVMDLGFSSVNIMDSKRMQKLTEAAVKDSAAMKQISYLTMVFLPSSFVAAVFGMNVTILQPKDQVNATLSQYFAVAVPLTIITIWIIVAFQIQMKEPPPWRAEEDDKVDTASRYSYNRNNTAESEVIKQLNVWDRLLWPVALLSTMLDRRKRRKEKEMRLGLSRS